MCGGVVLQGLATGVAHFIASRMLGQFSCPSQPLAADSLPTVGIGLCLATNSAPLLVCELAYPTQRAPSRVISHVFFRTS